MSESDPPPKAPKAPAGAEDVVFVHSPVEDGEGVRVVRKRKDTIELGEIRPVRSRATS
jgi:hypothetical protein